MSNKRPCVCGHGVSIHLLKKRNGERVYPCARLSCICENFVPPLKSGPKPKIKHDGCGERFMISDSFAATPNAYLLAARAAGRGQA